MKRKKCFKQVLALVLAFLMAIPVPSFDVQAETLPNEAEYYTLVYDANGGEGIMDSETVELYSGVSLAANAYSRENYAFGGWRAYRKSDKSWLYTDGQDTGWYISDSQPAGWELYVLEDGAEVSDLSSVNGDTVTLFAKWSYNAYTIKYDANGGIGAMDNTVALLDGSVTLSENMYTKEKYVFAGWKAYRKSDQKWLYTNGTEKGWYVQNGQPSGWDYLYMGNNSTVETLTAEASDVITLFARWRIATYTVRYDANGGNGEMGDTTINVSVLTKIAANAFTKEKHGFIGWNAENEDGEWYYSDGTGSGWYKEGSEPSGYEKYLFGEREGVLDLTTKDGAVITMYAQWVGSTYTIVYDANKGTGEMESMEAAVGSGVELTPNAYVRENYAFVGWMVYRRSDKSWLYTDGQDIGWYVTDSQPAGWELYVLEDGAAVSDLSSVNGDTVTLFAKWSYNTYTIKYDANGGIGAMDNTVALLDGSVTLSENMYTKENYVFAGWKAYRKSDQKWLYTNGTEKGWYVQNGQPSGWDYLYMGNNSTVETLTAEASDVITLFARWRIATYTVRYDANGGSGEMGDTTINVSVLTKIAANAFTKEKHGFIGWNAENEDGEWYYSDGTGSGWYKEGSEPSGYEKYLFGEREGVLDLTTKDGAVITMYAQWVGSTYTIVYDANKGTGEMESMEAAVGSGVELTPNAYVRENYAFVGWMVYRRSDKSWLYTDGQDTGWYISDSQPAGWELYVLEDCAEVIDLSNVNGDTVTLFAKWSYNTYTIKYDANGGIGAMDNTVALLDGSVTLSENMYTKENYVFAGWKAYRKSDQKWLYTNGTEKGWYVQNGQPSGWDYLYMGNNSTVETLTAEASDVITLFARWEGNAYYVAYMGNGAQGEMETELALLDSTYTIQDNLFYRAGCELTGWNVYYRTNKTWLYTNGVDLGWYSKGLQPSGYELAIYQSGDIISGLVDEMWTTIVLYAKWNVSVNTIDVTELGANGADTEDDTAMIQEALNLAKGIEDDVEFTVTIPKGTYYINKALRIYSNTNLLLDDEAIIKRVDQTNYMLLSSHVTDEGTICQGEESGCEHTGYSQCTNVTVSGGIWDGNIPDTETGYTALIYFQHCSDIVIDNTVIQNCSGEHLLIVDEGQNMTFNNITFKDHLQYTGSDMSYYFVDNPEDYTMDDVGYAQMFTKEALHLDFVSDEFHTSAFPVDNGSCNNIIIQNCTFLNCLSGVGTHNNSAKMMSNNIQVINNTFKNVQYDCINAYSYNNLLIEKNNANDVGFFVRAIGSNGVIRENIVNNAAIRMVFLQEGSSFSIEGNEFVQDIAFQVGGAIGIDGTGDVVEDEIEDETDAQCCIHITGNSDAIINGNTIKSSRDVGINIYDKSSAEILYNNISNCGYSAILANVNANIVVTNNKLFDVGNYGVYVTGDSEASIGNNEIDKSYGDGIVLRNNSKQAVLENNDLSDIGWNAIWVSNSNAVVQGNNIANCEEAGINFSGINFGSANDNHISNVAGYGIYVADGYKLDSLSNNVIKQIGKNAIYVNGASATITKTNDISDVEGTGIRIYNGSTDSQENTISNAKTNGIEYNFLSSGKVSGNKISDCSAVGVYAYNQSNVVIENNMIVNAGSHGILSSTDCKDIQVIKNHIISPVEYGIYIYKNCEVLLEDNKIENSGKSAIRGAESSKVTATGNDIIQSGSYGIQGSTNSYFMLDNNVITDSYSDAISLSNCGNDCSIINNIISRSKISGIIVYNSANANISGNQVEFSAKYGIQCNAADNITICTNILRENGNYGVYSYGGKDVTVCHNEVRDNGGSGIRVLNTSNVDVNENLTVNNVGYEIETVGATGQVINNKLGGNGVYINSDVFAENNTLTDEELDIYYEIKFDVNGGSGYMDSLTGKVGLEITLPFNTYLKEGYKFDGWRVYRQSDKSWLYTDGQDTGWYISDSQPAGWELYVLEDGAEVSDLSSVNGDTVTLFAKWSYNAYTIKYDANGGIGAMDNTVALLDGSVTLSENMYTKEKYVFAGWKAYRKSDQKWLYTNGTEKGWYVQNGQPSGWDYLYMGNNSTVETLTAEASDVITLFARWRIATYTVRYDANGGNGEMGDTTINVSVLTKIAANAFTKEKHGFIGWNAENEDGEWYYSDGTGSGWYKEGSEPSGYEKYLFGEREGVLDLTTKDGAVITMYAQWVGSTYTIVYDANKGTGEMESMEAAVGSGVELTPNAYVRENYAFVGWMVYRRSDKSWLYTDGQDTGWYMSGSEPANWTKHVIEDGDTVNLSSVDGDTVTLFAKWTAASYYTIKYDGNGGTGTMPEVKATVGSSHILQENAYSKAGNRFVGWRAYRKSDRKWYYTNGLETGWYEQGKQPLGYEWYVYDVGEEAPSFTETAEDTVTLFAKWTAASYYTIKYDGNGGTGTMPEVKATVGSSHILQENAYSKAGNRFVGWRAYRKSDRKWYYTNGLETGWYEQGKQPLGYEWYVYDVGEEAPSFTETAEDTVTLFAKWTAASYYTIKYDGNGGTGTMPEEKATVGSSHILQENAYSKAGNRFAGWRAYRKSDRKWYYTNGLETGWYEQGKQPSGYEWYVYDVGEEAPSFTETAEDTVTLFAKWTAASYYTIKYDGNGGTGTMPEVKATVGSSHILQENAYSKAGNRFAGWRAYRKSDRKWYYTNGLETGWYEQGKQPSGYEWYVYDVGEEAPSFTETAEDTVTLFAKWTVASYYTIKYDGNGGTGTMPEVKATVGSSHILQENAYSKAGNRFVGWRAYRKSDRKWYYTNGLETGWYEQGKQPSGYEWYVYDVREEAPSFTETAEDTVTLFAKWIKSDV